MESLFALRAWFEEWTEEIEVISNERLRRESGNQLRRSEQQSAEGLS